MRYEIETNEKGTPICNIGQFSENSSEGNMVNLFSNDQTPYIPNRRQDEHMTIEESPMERKPECISKELQNLVEKRLQMRSTERQNQKT